MNENIMLMDEGAALKALSSLGFSDPKTAFRNIDLLSRTALKGNVSLIVNSSSLSPSPDGALNNLETIAKEVPGEVLSACLKTEENLKRLVKICGSSRLLSNTISQNPSFFEWLFNGGLHEVKDFQNFREELRERTAGADSFDLMSKALRIYKQKEYLRIGSRDLLGIAPVDETTRELSDLASASLDTALEFSINAHKKLYGIPYYTDPDGNEKEAEFVVLGLGKLGGRELNFSSDIDIIYLYSSDKGETSGTGGKEDSKISLHAFFVKVSMMLNRLISGVTGDGIVFRVDLDLRPEGRSGDMANSLRSAEIYYESWGQTWERAAMIKARPVAGAIKLGDEFLSIIRPFVFRKYLDFTAIEEVKTMKERIDLSLLRRSPDTVDVKLGAGGIREIEFFCQALQLIHAGKDPEIRDKTTLKILGKLKLKGYIKEEEEKTLRESYVFLRNLEHRIQIVEGRQSQAIPARPEELERLARMMGFSDTDGKKAGEYFWEEYKRITSSVHSIYRSLFYKSEEENEVPKEILLIISPDTTEEEALARLLKLGFKVPEVALKNLKLLRTGPPFLHLSARAQVLLQKLTPRFLERAAKSPEPDKSLSNLERFISAVGARTTFYSLLAENPRVLDELVKLFGTSEFLSRDLIEHPESLDLLLSKELSIPYRKREDFFTIINELESVDDYEQKLDMLRRFKNQEVFRVGVNDIVGALTPRQVSIQLTFTAEAALEAAYRIALGELKKKYGLPVGSRFSIIALGKLGGKELNYGSDLDIIFLYSDDAYEGKTTGPKVVSDNEFYVKLGQRIISALTLRTKEGYVFNVDTRLRPSGSAGPLVVSRSSFLNYHRGGTLVWERQAFVKARSAAADTAYADGILGELKEIIYSKPLTPEDAEEMLRIRKRMEVEIAKETPTRYNIKTGSGAIVDIEFLVQALQLKHGGGLPSLRTPYTLKALKRLSKEGLIGREDESILKEAYNFYKLLEMRLRIVHDRPEGYLNEGSDELSTLARRAGYTGEEEGERLLNDYAKYAASVRAAYLRVLGSLKA